MVRFRVLISDRSPNRRALQSGEQIAFRPPHEGGYVHADAGTRPWRDAESFLDNLPQTAPAVVVTDMRMPGLSGVEMHTAMVNHGRSMPVIYISGETTIPETISAMKMGAVDFLVKPFSREALLKAVRHRH